MDLLAMGLAERPDAVALTDGRRRWSWRELARASAGLAATLRVPGGGGGEGRRTVAVVLPPSPEAVVAIHGVLRSGALLAPLNPGLAPPEVVRALRTLRPAVILTSVDREHALGDAVREAGIACRVLFVGPETLDGMEAQGGSVEMESVREPTESDVKPIAALWTSGTSGAPRAVLLSAAALRHSARASAARLGLGPDDRWYASLSPAHVGGLALVTRAAILGSTLVATGPFDAEELSRLADGGEVTHASLVPTMLRRLLDARDDRHLPDTFRCALVGGAHCPPQLLDRALAAGVPVALTWGMTETTSQAATAPPDLVRRKPGTVGAPLDGVEVRIDRAEGDGVEGARGDGGEGVEGEILVRGPVLALGRHAGEGAVEPLTDREGWLHTGDLGEIDEDGHLRVTGRRSDRIITGGVNVDPTEVVGVLLRHPAVEDAAVVGLPDPEWGERVVAAVVARPGRDGSEDAVALAEELREWLRTRLAGPKVPKEIMLLPSLPRTPNGKVDRAAVREAVVRSGSPP